MLVRGYNFSAGPAMLPEEILLEAQAELLNWQNRGMSVMEVGHRTEACQNLMQEAEEGLRALIKIPDHYRVLFLGGAARTQFSMIPMNCLSSGEQGAYWISGVWSSLAYEEASRLSQAYCLAQLPEKGNDQPLDPATLNVRDNTGYLYYTPNETIDGIRTPTPPVFEGIPMIADMTSCLLTEPVNISEFGLIFAGAQKNIANAGLTIVIVREDLLEKQPVGPIPTMQDYRVHAKHHSLYATPPVFNCYLASKMFHWIKKQGGVDAVYEQNCKKAEKLYQFIDDTSFYTCSVVPAVRSIVNICFTMNSPNLEEQFIHQANRRGLLGLKGHRAIGGLRASLYNSMPMSGVQSLIEFMHEFSKEHST